MAKRAKKPRTSVAKRRTRKSDKLAEATRSAAEDQERFVTDVLTRGEAAERDSHGNLPPGATHEIVKQEPGKLPEIRRARFSLV